MADEKKRGVVEWPDLGPFGWVVHYDVQDHWLDFKAYEIASVEQSPNKGQRWFARKGATDGMDMTLDISDAEPDVDGFVKWDGCSEMSIGQPHFCGAHDVATLAKAMVDLHKLALLIPRVDRDCAGYKSAPNGGDAP